MPDSSLPQTTPVSKTVDSEGEHQKTALGPPDSSQYQQDLCHIQQVLSEMGTSRSKEKSFGFSSHKDISSGKNAQPHVDVSGSDTKTVIDSKAFTVLKIKSSIDKKPTTLDEKSSAVFKYRTPHFRAMATVEVPVLPENHSIQLGWIQTCTEMKFVNTYGTEGITSWEFPEIETGKYTMVSDSDGKLYPWYGAKHEVTTICGPSTRQSVTVHMNDNFFPQVTWYIPGGKYSRAARLTHVYRKQQFYSFLVAKDLVSGKHHVLRTITWSMEFQIRVNPQAPLGKRAWVSDGLEHKQPHILDGNPIALEPQALLPPNANNSQALVWRPREGQARVVVAPVQSTVNMEKYLLMTQDLGCKLAKWGTTVEELPQIMKATL